MNRFAWRSDSQVTGLLECFPNTNDTSFCVLKTIELSISLILILFSTTQLYKQIRLYEQLLRWQVVTLLLITLSLLFNVFFCLWNTAYELFSLQTYTNNLYFVAIVGFVCYKYIEKKGFSRWRYALIAFIFIMFILYTAIMVQSIIERNNPSMVNNSCQELWSLCVNATCLFLCAFALIVLYVNQRQEHSRIQRHNYSSQHVRNPMKGLWIWMGTNTLAQIFDLVETGLLMGATPKNSCMIVPNNQVSNNVLMFSFALLTMGLGYAATLWYYIKTRRIDEKRNSNMLTQAIDLQRYSQEIKIGNIELLIPHDSL